MDDTRYRRERATIATLFTGYAGYYVCRSNYSIAGPYLTGENGLPGFDKEQFGAIASFGVAAYAIGKVVNGLLVDRWGGRKAFLLGMFLSVVMTVGLGLASGLTTIAVLWVLNRWCQSMGWVALVKVSAVWFPVARLATIMGTLSGSFLIGDALARGYLSVFLRTGFGWRQMFFVAAGTLLCIAVGAAVLLPPEAGDAPGHSAADPEPKAAPAAIEPGTSIWAHWWPLLSNRVFWLVCGVNFGLTMLREAFGTWTPMILTEVAGLGGGVAATASLTVPLAGGVAAILAGKAVDRTGCPAALVTLPFLGLLVLSLLVMAYVPMTGRPWLAFSIFRIRGSRADGAGSTRCQRTQTQALRSSSRLKFLRSTASAERG